VMHRADLSARCVMHDSYVDRSTARRLVEPLPNHQLTRHVTPCVYARTCKIKMEESICEERIS